MDKYLILVSRSNSKSGFSNITHTFGENDSERMQKFIELKTNAGFQCHQFDLAATFSKESHITHTVIR
jgi:hypothetical protein